MGIAIILIAIVLLAGYAGSRLERRRSSSITKRDADQLRLAISEMKVIFESHHDVHKVLKYNIEVLSRDVTTVATAIGLKKVVPRHNA